MYRLPEGVDESKLPPLRWRRGLIADADSEHRKKILALGAQEISREEAAEVVVDETPRKAKAKE